MTKSKLNPTPPRRGHSHDGGPAFPLPGIDHSQESQSGYKGMVDFTQGLSIRDYFAAQALAGCEVTVRDDMGLSYFEPAHDIAKRCYQIADAMLERRENGR
jgi:hypothetical protein